MRVSMKMHLRFLLCLTLLIFASLKAQDDNSQAPLPTLSESEVLHFQMLVEGNNRFAFDLYQQIRLHQTGSLYFSPYSIASGLNMLTIGAKGETAQPFQHAFRYSPPLLLFIGDLNESLQSSRLRNSAQVTLANALWIDKSIPILPSFKQTFMRNFRTTLQPVDFAQDLNQSVQRINQWVLHQTQGKISNMISVPDVNVNMQMILTTAASLKGEWASPFDQKLTKRLPFHISVQRTSLVDMMQNTAQYLLAKGEKEEVLLIPFAQEGGPQIVMTILLPKEGMALSELEKRVTWENWRQWKGQLQSQWVTLALPRFRIDRRLDLEMTLKSLGFAPIFSPQADFSGMTSQKGVFLNQAFHKTSIRIDEKGADRGQPAKIKPTANIPKDTQPYAFTVDRPCVFIIWDQKTDAILFMGRLMIP